MNNSIQTFKLYNGEVELTFNEEKHLYVTGGYQVDGVTSVLQIINKPALMYWAVNMALEHIGSNLKPGQALDEVQLKKLLADAKIAHRAKSTDAADIGTMIHEWIEKWITGKKPETPINVQMKQATDSFLKWVDDNNVKFVDSERMVYSKKWGYAGTLDFTATIGKEFVIGDIKTSTGIWDEYWLQVAAYEQAFREEFADKDVARAVIVRVGKDASLEIKDSVDYKKNVMAFNAALVLHRRIREMKDEAYKAKQGGGVKQ
jgi:hypothetical protein